MTGHPAQLLPEELSLLASLPRPQQILCIYLLAGKNVQEAVAYLGIDEIDTTKFLNEALARLQLSEPSQLPDTAGPAAIQTAIREVRGIEAVTGQIREALGKNNTLQSAFKRLDITIETEAGTGRQILVGSIAAPGNSL